jgi:hypothetical protein
VSRRKWLLVQHGGTITLDQTGPLKLISLTLPLYQGQEP